VLGLEDGGKVDTSSDSDAGSVSALLGVTADTSCGELMSSLLEVSLGLGKESHFQAVEERA
jgi:hypothetical protein